MIKLDSIPRQRLLGPRFTLVSLLAHTVFFLAFYPSLSLNVMKPNVPVMVRIITDLPKPKKEQAPIKTKTAALSNADRRAKGPKVLERSHEPKHPKVRIMAKAIKPTRPIVPPLEKPLPKPVKQKLEPPKPKEALTAKLYERRRILPKRTPPPLLPSQGVPKLRKLPLLTGDPHALLVVYWDLPAVGVQSFQMLLSTSSTSIFHFHEVGPPLKCSLFAFSPRPGGLQTSTMT